MIELTYPYTEEAVRKLKVGDTVELTGLLYTGRDAVHKYLHDGGKPPVDFTDAIIYHCGPVVVEEDGKFIVKAAGPTTSIREEPYQGDIMKQYGIRGVIGKGGMGPKTLAALKEIGGCYFHAIGGAAQVLAQRIENVSNVYMKEELGSPEAIWEMHVVKFPVVVTMDSHGNSLHQEISDLSKENLKKLCKDDI